MNTPHDLEDYRHPVIRDLASQASPVEVFGRIYNGQVDMRTGIAMLLGKSSARQAVEWYKRLRIKGPIAGRLYVCYRHDKPGRTATALTPEGAYSAWQSYWGTQA